MTLIGRIAIWLLAGITGVIWIAFTASRPPVNPFAGQLVEGTLEPAAMIVRTRMSGTVSVLHTRAATPVVKHQVLLELEDPDAAMAISITGLRGAVGGLLRGPAGRQVELHPDVVAAESEYVAALANLENGDPENQLARGRLQRAADRRAQTRLRITNVLNGATGTLDSLASQFDQLREQRKVRAPADAVVEIVGPKPGERVVPGQPVAVLLVPGQYEAEVVPSRDYPMARLHPGLSLRAQGKGSSGPTQATVHAITRRRLPVALRPAGEPAEQVVVRLRMQSEQPVAPGTRVSFLLP